MRTAMVTLCLYRRVANLTYKRRKGVTQLKSDDMSCIPLLFRSAAQRHGKSL
jgi:hypothetical protein